MLSLRARLFIIISLIVLVILGISIFLVIRSKKPVGGETTTTTVGGNTVNVIDSSNFNYNPNFNTPLAGGEVPQGTPIKPSTPLEIEQNAVRQLAKIFVERYNSYSTDNNFQNIIDVKELVTPELWQTLSAKIGKTQTAGSFMGVTTKVFTSELKDWGSKAATVSLSTAIREEKNGALSNRQQDLTVDLIKSGDGWLVAKFQWSK
jgi:hypothetical protein